MAKVKTKKKVKAAKAERPTLQALLLRFKNYWNRAEIADQLEFV